MQNYQVGQILFLITDSTKVIPIQVFEEVTRTTLSGKEKTYIIKLPDKKSTSIDIKKIKGKLFNNKNDVKAFMLTNAQNAINHMLSEAEDVSHNVFGGAVRGDSKLAVAEKQGKPKIHIEKKLEIPKKVQQEEKEDIIKVDLGNGTIGKISASELGNAGASKWTQKYFY